MSCEHDKVYSVEVITTNPPKQQWICRKCAEMGYDRGEFLALKGEFKQCYDTFVKLGRIKEDNRGFEQFDDKMEIFVQQVREKSRKLSTHWTTDTPEKYKCT